VLVLDTFGFDYSNLSRLWRIAYPTFITVLYQAVEYVVSWTLFSDAVW